MEGENQFVCCPKISLRPFTDYRRRPPANIDTLLCLRVKHHSSFGLDPCLGSVKIKISDLLLKCYKGPSEIAFSSSFISLFLQLY